MARKGGKLLLEARENKRYRADQILEGAGIWAVLYCGKPINIRNVNTILTNPVAYKKTVFATAAPAYNLAARLNATFRTDQFSVLKLL